jgi:hypothetical protein
MKRNKPPQSFDRPAQQTPAELVAFLCQFIRAGFYRECPEKWFADQHFIRKRVILWPATWLNDRGVTLSPGRYQDILVGIFTLIKQHGQTETVKYWPGYLLHCVQEHFKHHGDEIYEEAKALRSRLDNVVMGLERAKDAKPALDPVAELARLQAAMTTATRKKKAPAKSQAQMSLL